MSNILTKILARKVEEIAERLLHVSQAELVARCADLPTPQVLLLRCRRRLRMVTQQ